MPDIDAFRWQSAWLISTMKAVQVLLAAWYNSFVSAPAAVFSFTLSLKNLQSFVKRRVEPRSVQL